VPVPAARARAAAMRWFQGLKGRGAGVLGSWSLAAWSLHHCRGTGSEPATRARHHPLTTHHTTPHHTTPAAARRSCPTRSPAAPRALASCASPTSRSATRRWGRCRAIRSTGAACAAGGRLGAAFRSRVRLLRALQCMLGGVQGCLNQRSQPALQVGCWVAEGVVVAGAGWSAQWVQPTLRVLGGCGEMLVLVRRPPETSGPGGVPLVCSMHAIAQARCRHPRAAPAQALLHQGTRTAPGPLRASQPTRLPRPLPARSIAQSTRGGGGGGGGGGRAPPMPSAPHEVDGANTVLFIGGLGAGVTEDQLRGVFSRWVGGRPGAGAGTGVVVLGWRWCW
jgi:hypothetical protein